MRKEEFQPVLNIPLKNLRTLEEAALRRFQSERFIFTVQIEKNRYKVCQIFFGKSDGTLYVTFPYFQIKEGIASICTTGPFLVNANVDMKTSGKLTSYPLKYSHHPDGEAHFSQDAKVKTLIRKKSVPLHDVEDHIFSLYAQGLSYFEEDITAEDHKPTLKRMTLNFDFKNQKPKAVKIVGRWYIWEDLIRRVQGKFVRPTVTGETPDKKAVPMFLIGPPKGWPMDKYFLCVSCEEIGDYEKGQDAAMLFIGGFDDPSRVYDLSQSSTFLCSSYPVSNYKELLAQIGSIDVNERRFKL